MTQKITIILLLILSTSSIEAECNNAYRSKYMNVINKYQQMDADSLKYRAALFLIDNMEGHKSPYGQAIKEITKEISELKPQTKPDILANLCKEKLQSGYPIFMEDSALVTDSMLINYIEGAFTTWKTAPWAEEISFDNFCKYILPYRALNESLSKNWREALRKEYMPLIEGIEDIKEAYQKVMKHLDGKIKTPNPTGIYTIDVLSYNYMQRASCEQRCVLFACILRSLCIPVAIDMVPVWADYSVRGHAWVTLVIDENTSYTIRGNTRNINAIDASMFNVEYSNADALTCTYDIMTSKRVAKVYRYSYQKMDIAEDAHKMVFANGFMHDISKVYGLNDEFIINTDDDGAVYLCTFLTGKDWIPIAVAKPSHGKVVFNDIGDGIVYVAARIEDGKLYPLTNPTLFEANHPKTFNPDYSMKRTVTLSRKYPLCSIFPNKWILLKGGVFEGSNNIDFGQCDTLHTITSMPYGIRTINIETTKRYRYARFKSADDKRGLLAELSFITDEESALSPQNKPEIISYGVYEGWKPFVNDNDCGTSIKVNKEGYWIGYDLGDSAQCIKAIRYSPVSDTNFVEEGHEYELRYYDMGWKVLGKKTANDPYVSFDNIPTNTILLLKDKTKGVEERIFDYSEGKQIWH